MPSSRPAIRIGIAAIFKNEAPYVLEWLAHHRLLGVTAFFIADNESTDGTSELLQALDEAGLVHCLPFPNPPSGKPQLPAYRELLKRHGAAVDWMAIIDADEFLWPDTPGANLGRWLADHPPAADVGAVALNWAVYGSAGALRADPRLLTQRMNARADKAFHANHHFKSLVRPASVEDVVNPHCVTLEAPYRYAHADGSECPQLRAGLSRTIHWSPFRINHYVVKSWSEYMLRKRPRGTADGPDDGYPAAFFHEHDRNDVVEPPPSDHLCQLQNEVTFLRQKLSERGFDVRRIDRLSSSELPIPQGLFQGSLESVECDQQGIRLTGWALSRHRRSVPQFSLMLGGGRSCPVSAVHLPRDDVRQIYPGSELASGFVIEVDWKELTDSPWATPALMGHDATGISEQIATGPLVDWPEIRKVAEQGCHIAGHIDSIEVVGAHLLLRGWALAWKRHALRSLELRGDTGFSVPLTLRFVDRPDVVSVHPNADTRCGFEARFPLPRRSRSVDLFGTSTHNRRGLLGQVLVPASTRDD